MKKNKTEKGITLVALIITIIVLLILAVVAIGVVTGDGILFHAKDASTKYAEKAEEENSTLQGYAEMIEEQTGGTGKVSKDSLVEQYKAGNLKVGDYVGYQPSVVTTPYDPDEGEAIGSKTGFVSGVHDWQGNAGGRRQNITQESLNWRVLGYDEEKGELLLISGAPTIQGLSLYGHIGYFNAEEIFNSACSTLYSNTSLGATARSIKMEDIDTYLDGSKFKKTTYGGGRNKAGGYGYTQSFSSIYNPDYIDSQTGKQVWSKTWSGSLTSDDFDYIATDYITDTTKLDLLLGKERTNSYYYWLASHSVYVTSTDAYWGPGFVVDGDVCARATAICAPPNGIEYGDSICLRPIVSLKANVTTKEVPILEQAPTENWNDPLG